MASDRSYQTITPTPSIQTQYSRHGDIVLDDVPLNSQHNHVLHYPPKSYVLRSFLVLIFCCPIVGFVALLYAFQVDPYFNEKKLSEARIASQMAKKLNMAGIFIGILGNFSLFLAIYYITISAL